MDLPHANTLLTAFAEHFGTLAGVRTFYAPGRVNLIGEHTDYNDGFVLPLAINKGTTVLAAPITVPNATVPNAMAPNVTSKSALVLNVYAANVNETCRITLGDKPMPGHWSSYVAGMLDRLTQAGFPLVSANMLISGTIPIGSGLSSSASLECAVGLALLGLAGNALETADKHQLALAGQWAEHHYAGTMCGIMDQLASALGQANHALLIDCRSQHIQPVPLPDVALVITDSRVSHSLAGSAYNERRASCMEAVTRLQPLYPTITALRDVSPAQLEAARHALNDTLYRRARHVVTENARVLAMAQALQQLAYNPMGDEWQTIGQCMAASHASLQADYAVSCPELDSLVDAAQGLDGVVGSRMTGGGFGGCTISLVQPAQVERFKQHVATRYQQAFNTEPAFYVTTACEGAMELS
jgi:galactokinase